MKWVNWLIAYTLFGRLLLYIWSYSLTDFDAYSHWSNAYFIWIKGLIAFAFLVIRTLIKDVNLRGALKLVAVFWLITIAWEIIILIRPPLQTSEKLINILFGILLVVIICIAYYPQLKKLWERRP